MLNLLALGAQLLLGGWLFRAIGLHRALWILPALLFVGAAGAGARRRPGRGAAAEGRRRDAPQLAPPHRHRAALRAARPTACARAPKPLVDIVGQRGGQALASVLILSESVPRARRRGARRGGRGDVARVDRAGGGPEGPLPRRVPRRAARGHAAARGRPAAGRPRLARDAVRRAQQRRRPRGAGGDRPAGRRRAAPGWSRRSSSTTRRRRVVLQALQLFARDGRTDFLPVADRLLRHADPEIRAAALRARTRVGPDQELLRAAAADASPLVRATARGGPRGLRARGRAGRGRRSRSSSAADDAQTSVALARAIAAQPLPVFEDAAAAARRERRRGRARAGDAGDGRGAQPGASCPCCSGCWRSARCGPRRGRRSWPTEPRGSRSWPRRCRTRRSRSSCADSCRAAWPSSIPPGGGGAAAPPARGARGRAALPDPAGSQPAGVVVRRGARRRRC